MTPQSNLGYYGNFVYSRKYGLTLSALDLALDVSVSSREVCSLLLMPPSESTSSNKPSNAKDRLRPLPQLVRVIATYTRRPLMLVLVFLRVIRIHGTISRLLGNNHPTLESS